MFIQTTVQLMAESVYKLIRFTKVKLMLILTQCIESIKL